MAKGEFDDDAKAEAAKNMFEPWMAKIAAHYVRHGETSMSEEDKLVLYNLWRGEVNPLITLLKSPEKPIPLQVRVVLIQMLVGSEKIDYHLKVSKAAHLGKNGHSIWDKIKSQNEFETNARNIGEFIVKKNGTQRGYLQSAIWDATVEFGMNERAIKDHWFYFKKHFLKTQKSSDK